jgi:hypothetical protein
MQQKSREIAVRRIASRRGYTASKSRLRDPLAIGYGRWTVTDRKGRRISPEDGWTLEQVEQWLERQEDDHDDRQAAQGSR